MSGPTAPSLRRPREEPLDTRYITRYKKLLSDDSPGRVRAALAFGGRPYFSHQRIKGLRGTNARHEREVTDVTSMDATLWRCHNACTGSSRAAGDGAGSAFNRNRNGCGHGAEGFPEYQRCRYVDHRGIGRRADQARHYRYVATREGGARLQLYAVLLRHADLYHSRCRLPRHFTGGQPDSERL